MGIFLMILKIIGITLAVLVGLILLIVMLVLFVPIRYKGNGQYPYAGNKLPADVHATVSWLLHLIHVTFDTTAEGQVLKVKVFGITIMNNDPAVAEAKAEKQKKKQEKREAKIAKKKEKARKAKLKAKKKVDAKRKKMMDSQKQKHSNQQDKEFKKWSKEQKKNKKSQKNANVTSTKKENSSSAMNDSLGSLDRAYFDTDAVKRLKEEKNKANSEQDSASTEQKPKISEASNADKKTPAKPGTKEYIKEHTDQWEKRQKSEIYDENVKIFDDEDDEYDEDIEDSGEEEEAGPKVSIFTKIVEKLKGIVQIPKKIYNKIKGIFEKIKNYKDFIDDKRVRSAIKYILKKVKLIIKRVLPKKLSGHATFGMDDPATTGYIYGGACMFYGVWSKNFELTPDFNQKRLEADAKFKGRIIIITLLIPAVKILLNKDFKYLRHRLDKLKSSSEEQSE